MNESPPDNACRKCNAPMTPVPPGNGPFAALKFTVTGFRCDKCGHWNNLKSRGKRKPNTL